MEPKYTSKELSGEDIIYLYSGPNTDLYKYKHIDNFVDGESEITTKDSTTHLKEFIKKEINQLSDQIGKHDTKQSDERKKMLQQFATLQTENEYFKRQIAEIYTPRKLQYRSLLVAIMMLICIAFSLFSDINLIHPILSSFILLSAIVFHIMSLIMKKQDNKKF